MKEDSNIYQVASRFWETRTSMVRENFDPTLAYTYKTMTEEWLVKYKWFYQFGMKLISKGTHETSYYRKLLEDNKNLATKVACTHAISHRGCN